MRLILPFVVFMSAVLAAPGQQVHRTYNVPASRQGVAVHGQHFFVVNNHSITKHLKADGALVASWEDTTGVIEHLNSGIVLDSKLYSCNSNYPKSPMASSIEIYDPVTLEHIGSHSFGIGNGSATWLDRYQDHWYVAFAHYTGRGAEGQKDNTWTRLVRFDHEWRQLESWIFPEGVVQKFGTRSNSGGFILPNGDIYCTGHDEPELYVLRFPKMGYTLDWIDTVPFGGEGQGVAYEIVNDKHLIYGIVKGESKVVVTELPMTTN